MEQLELKANLRDGKRKQAVKKLRDAGRVPGVVYHRGEKSVEIWVDDKELSRLLRTAGEDNLLINLKIDDEKPSRARAVLLKEVQHHPVKRGVLHVDFNEISLKEKITIEVEVVHKGEPIGVRQEGGHLDHPMRQIKIQCLPTDIPKHVEVDVTGLKLNQSIHVSDLNLGDKIKILTDPDALLFQVKVHEEKAEEPAAAETPEVEVIREKKEEAGEAGGKEAPKEETKAEKK